MTADGFEIGFGVSLDAEVDDIEAGLALGPFKFVLDEVPSEDDGKDGDKAACANLQCDLVSLKHVHFAETFAISQLMTSDTVLLNVLLRICGKD